MLGAQALRFGVLSMISFAVNLGSTVALREVVGLSAETSFALALVAVIAMNFVLLRHYVYRPRRPGPLGRELAVYLPSTAAFRGAEYLAFLGLLQLAGLDYRLAVLVVLATSTLAKFFYYRVTLGASA